MPRVELPEAVVDNLGAFGEAGPRWAEDFHWILERVLQQWGLTLEALYEDLSYHFVARVRRGAEPLVLKLGVPLEELRSEIAALRQFAGRGMAVLLDADAELGALLLERIDPGRPLSELDDDDRAMAIAAERMQALWCPPPDEATFWTVSRWGRAVRKLLESGTPTPLAEHLEHADRMLQAATPDGQVKLMHGDYHQYNVLQRGDGSWVVIDPKGAVGDPGYEVWPLMLNCLDCDDPVARLQARARRLARETPLDEEHILRWTHAGATLSAAWDVEDAGPGRAPDLTRVEWAATARR